MDLHRGEVRLHGDQTKNAEPITLPLPEELIEMLRGAEHTSERVFDVGSFRTAWENACARLELGSIIKLGERGRRYKGLIIQDLRRSAVRNLIRAGVPETVAMKISGHKTRHIFDRYNITDTADVREAMKKIDQSLRAAKLGANLVQMKPRKASGAA